MERKTIIRKQTLKVSEREKRNSALAMKAACEGMVLLENNGILPLREGSAVALYGYGARHTVKGGTGSGSVNNRSDVLVYEGLKNMGFKVLTEEWLDEFDRNYDTARARWETEILERTGTPIEYRKLYHEHSSHHLCVPGEKIPRIEDKADTEVAIYVLSRLSGEFADRKAAKGDYYLSDDEHEMLKALTEIYRDTILVLNVGGIVDLSVLDELDISAVVLMNQAGMEGGNALARVLGGSENPAGRLTDTWAFRYEDYPNSDSFSHNNGNVFEEKYKEGIYVGYRYFDTFDVAVRYPIGYGLSYTTFDIKTKEVSLDEAAGLVNIAVRVTNRGSVAGKELIQAYVACPMEKYLKEKRRLVGFVKTGELAAQESAEYNITFDLKQLESWHSGHASYYMEAGDYYVFTGKNIMQLDLCATLHLSEFVWTQRLKNICPLLDALKEITPDRDKVADFRDKCEKEAAKLPCIPIDNAVKERRSPDYSKEQLSEDNKDSSITELLSKMSIRQKAMLCCGRLRSGSTDAVGSASATVAGAAGESTPTLYDEFGIDNIVMADGPAGLRLMQKYQLNDEGCPATLDQIHKLLNRCFGHEFLDENKPIYYQFCTALPIGTMLAQTYDEGLLEQLGSMVAEEMEEFGVDIWLAPGMNIHRNPLCGRNYEYYSEDPLLSGRMAAALVRGVQQDGTKGATIKHFACNNQEENRTHSSSIVSERALREIYLAGFEYAVKHAAPKAIMTSYNKINGVHAANNYDLCTLVARCEWEFDGVIMSDWTTTNGEEGCSAAKCMYAGNDLIMPGTTGDIREIEEAVKCERDQNLEEIYLDNCAYRMLRLIKKIKG